MSYLKFYGLFLFLLGRIYGQEYTYPLKTTEVEIVLDGLLDEKVWAQVPTATNFFEHWPSDSIPSPDKTEVFLTADKDYLYLAARCYLNKGERYQANNLFRDFDILENDSFVFLLDPYADRLNGFSFEVTPFGSQGERLISNGGVAFNDFDYNWDNKWFSAVKRNEDHWVVEMSIPLRTLRFKPGTNKWRVNFIRNNRSANRNSSWYPIPVNMNLINLQYTGELQWDTVPKRTRLNLALIPSITSTFNRDHEAEISSWEEDITPSLDMKLGFGSSLNLDITANPDFSQIEVDRQQLNIGRFELFFPERRQFFLENSDLFANFGNVGVRPFFSRRIGIVSNPNEEFEAVPILGGLRLSGKAGGDSRIGLMNVITDDAEFPDMSGDSTLVRTGNNYFVSTYQHQLLERSTISVLYTDRQAKGNGWNDNYDRVIGGQFEWISKNDRWSGDSFYFHNLKNATNDLSYGISIRHSSTHIGLFSSFTHVGNKFDPDMGFVPRSGVKLVGLAPFYVFRPQNPRINNIDVFFDTNHVLSRDFKFLDSNIFTGTFINFANTSNILLALNSNYTLLTDDFDPSFSDAVPLAAGTEYYYPSVRLRYRTDQRKFLSGSLQLEYGEYFNGKKFTLTSVSTLRWQPYLEFSVDFIYNDIRLPDPNGSNQIYLIRPQARISLSKSLFITYISQYNSLQENLGNNIRFQWRFRPVSDLFIVYGDNYSSNLMIRNRGFSLKFIYWI